MAHFFKRDELSLIGKFIMEMKPGLLAQPPLQKDTTAEARLTRRQRLFL
jgi:hypothetical protein